MSVESPDTRLWTAGEEVNAAVMNETGKLMKWLLEPPEIWMRQTTAQSIPTIAWTAINFQTVMRDNYADFEGGEPHWVVGSPSEIVIQAPGWYEVRMAVHWSASAAVVSRMHSLRVNNSADALHRARHDRTATSSGSTSVARRYVSSYSLFLDAGDIVNLMVAHVSGAAVSTAVGIPYTELRLRWFQVAGKYA